MTPSCKRTVTHLAPQHPWYPRRTLSWEHGQWLSLFDAVFICKNSIVVSLLKCQIISEASLTGLHRVMCVLVAQLCPTLCDPMDCTLSDSSDYGISPGENPRVVTIPFSRESS